MAQRQGSRRGTQRIPDDTLQAVREGVELGWTYGEICHTVGVSPGVVANVRRGMGLVRSRAHKRWQATPEPIIEAAREMLLKGGSIRDVMQGVGAPYSRVKRLRRDLGLTQPRTPRSEQQPPQAPPAEDIAPTPPAPDNTCQWVEASSNQYSPWSLSSSAPHEQQTPAPHPSAAYFQAIRDGILEGHAREQALEEHVAILQSRIAELDAKCRDYYDTLTQIRAQMSTWAGPAPIPRRNLSTGG